MMNKPDLQLSLLYKGQREGSSALSFHFRCDNKGPTICLIKSEHGKTFGGYTNLNWNSYDNWIAGEGKSFIFQLDYNTKHNCIKNETEIGGFSETAIDFG
jgi:hypothetical protein